VVWKKVSVWMYTGLLGGGAARFQSTLAAVDEGGELAQADAVRCTPSGAYGVVCSAKSVTTGESVAIKKVGQLPYPLLSLIPGS